MKQATYQCYVDCLATWCYFITCNTCYKVCTFKPATVDGLSFLWPKSNGRFSIQGLQCAPTMFTIFTPPTPSRMTQNWRTHFHYGDHFDSKNSICWCRCGPSSGVSDRQNLSSIVKINILPIKLQHECNTQTYVLIYIYLLFKAERQNANGVRKLDWWK